MTFLLHDDLTIKITDIPMFTFSEFISNIVNDIHCDKQPDLNMLNIKVRYICQTMAFCANSET